MNAALIAANGKTTFPPRLASALLFHPLSHLAKGTSAKNFPVPATAAKNVPFAYTSIQRAGVLEVITVIQTEKDDRQAHIVKNEVVETSHPVEAYTILPLFCLTPLSSTCSGYDCEAMKLDRVSCLSPL